MLVEGTGVMAILSLSTSLDVAKNTLTGQCFTQTKWEHHHAWKSHVVDICFFWKTIQRTLVLHLYTFNGRFEDFQCFSRDSHVFSWKPWKFCWWLSLIESHLWHFKNWNQYHFPGSSLTTNPVAIISSHVCVLNRVFEHACYMLAFFAFKNWGIENAKMKHIIFHIHLKSVISFRVFFRNRILR